MAEDTSPAESPGTKDQEIHAADRTVIIGNRRRWSNEGRITSGLRDFVFLDFSELSYDALSRHAPDIVLSPLVGDDFDVIDVAQTLTDLGYLGRYRAIADTLPDIEMIRREVGELADDLDFDVLVMADNPQEKALRDVEDRPETAPHFPDNEKRRA